MIPKTCPLPMGYLRSSLSAPEPRRLERSTTDGEEGEVPELIDRKDGMLEHPFSHSMTEAMAAKEGVQPSAPVPGDDSKSGPRTGRPAPRVFPATDSIQHVRAWFDQNCGGVIRDGDKQGMIADYGLTLAEFEEEMAHGLTQPGDDHTRLKELAHKLALNPLKIMSFDYVTRMPPNPDSWLVYPIGRVARALEGIRRSLRKELHPGGPSSGDTAGSAATQRLEHVLGRYTRRVHVPIGVPEQIYSAWLADPSKLQQLADAQVNEKRRNIFLSCILQCELIQILCGAGTGPVKIRHSSPVVEFITKLESAQGEAFLVLKDNANWMERCLEDLVTIGPALLKSGQLQPEEFENDMFAAANCYSDCRMRLSTCAKEKLQMVRSLLGDAGRCAAFVGPGHAATGEPEADGLLAQERAKQVLSRKPDFIDQMMVELDAAEGVVPGLEDRVLKVLEEAPGMARLHVARAIERLGKMAHTSPLPPHSGAVQASTASLPDTSEGRKVRRSRHKQQPESRQAKAELAQPGQTVPEKPEAATPELSSRTVEKRVPPSAGDGEPDRKARHLRNKLVRAHGGQIGIKGLPVPVPEEIRTASLAAASSSAGTSTLSSGTSQSSSSTASLTYDPALLDSLRLYKDAVRAFERAGYKDIADSHRKFSADDKKSYVIAEHGGLNQELPWNRRKDISKFLTQHAGLRKD